MCLSSIGPVRVLTLLRGSGRRPFLVPDPCVVRLRLPIGVASPRPREFGGSPRAAALLLPLVLMLSSGEGTAVVLSGGFSRLCIGRTCQYRDDGAKQVDERIAAMVNLTARAIAKYVIQPNGRCDIFLFSWDVDLESTFRAAYGADLRSAEFVANAPMLSTFQGLPGITGACSSRSSGCSWREASKAYATYRGFELVRQHEETRGHPYAAVLFTRPDVLRFRPLVAEEVLRRNDTVYHPMWHHKGGMRDCGDFHFLMARHLAAGFVQMFRTAATTRACAVGCACCTVPPCPHANCSGTGVPDQQCWPSEFIRHFMHARQDISRSKDGHTWVHDRDERPYRSLGSTVTSEGACRFAPEPRRDAPDQLRSQLEELQSIGFGRQHYHALAHIQGHGQCAWFVYVAIGLEIGHRLLTSEDRAWLKRANSSHSAPDAGG
jgi:hypothetical protein